MNVIQGNKFFKSQRGKRNVVSSSSLNIRRFGNVNNVGLISRISVQSKTPMKYPFDSSQATHSVCDTSHRTSIMGPPSAPYSRLWRKSGISSKNLPEASSNSGSRPSATDISFTKGLWTPKYRNMPGQPTSSTSRGLVSGSRSRTTPCSSTSNTTVPDSCIVIAISEGRGAARGEVGVAAVDLRRPKLTLCQLSDGLSYMHTLTTIHFLNPVEIIVPNTFCDSVPTELYKVLKSHFSRIPLTSVQRKHFSDTQGLHNIQRLCAPEYSSVQLQLIHKFYALTAAGAVLKYVEFIQCVVFQPSTLKIEYHCSENSTLIDVETAIRLELVESLSGSNERGSSLLSVLNHTCTAGGLRALRASILQPPRQLKTILNRLDSVQELLQNSEGLMPALQSVMKQLYDVDKILWLCMELPNQGGTRNGEAQLTHTLQLKTTMDLVPSLIAALAMAQGEYFRTIRQDLENPKFLEISERIKRVIHEDAHLGHGTAAQHQRFFAVKPEINGLLDVARRSYSELVSDILERVQQLSSEYKLPLRLHSNATRGFHIFMPLGPKKKRNFNMAIIPPVFFEVQNHSMGLSMITEEIVLLDQQARESLNEIQTMSNIVIFGLLTELRPYMSVLYKLCENVAELDVILSLAQVSSTGYYTRPEFGEHLELKNSIHPMLDYVIPTATVPNDVYSSPEYNFTILTGPNMGGKTIYIKQIALLQIMAQMGCYVPANVATFRIADRIFSRIGFNDSLEYNSSTYVLEMKEIHYILQTITPNSLVIVDELCRGTSSEEGTSVAWALCEHFLNTNAFTFFTTHFLYLTRLQDLYCNVVNLHTAAEEVFSEENQRKQLIYRHKLVPGVTSINHYGLTLARNTNLPATVISLAEELAVIISSQRKPHPLNESVRQNEVLLYKLAADLSYMCRKKDANDEKLNEILNKFKEENPQLLQSILAEPDINDQTNDVNDTERSKSGKDLHVSLSDCSQSKRSKKRLSQHASQENPFEPADKIHRREIGISLSGQINPNTQSQKKSQESPIHFFREMYDTKKSPAQKVAEDIHTIVMVSRETSNNDSAKTRKDSSEKMNSSSNITPIKTINHDKPLLTVEDSDLMSEYIKMTSADDSSFFSDNRFENKNIHYHGVGQQLRNCDIDQPTTSREIAEHTADRRIQNMIVTQRDSYADTDKTKNMAKLLKNLQGPKIYEDSSDQSSEDDDYHRDELQEYLTNKMNIIFDGVEPVDDIKSNKEQNPASTEELHDILNSPKKSILSPVEDTIDEDLEEVLQIDDDDDDDLSDGDNNIESDKDTNISDLENFINDLIMTPESS